MAARGPFSFIHPDNLTPATLKDAVSNSHDERPATGHKFREISITLDLYRWKGEPAMKSPESVIEELATQMNELDTIGIMLRHSLSA